MRITIQHLERPTEAVYRLRGLIRLPLPESAAFWDDEHKRDCKSIIFAFNRGQELIGTMRCIPFGLGVSTTEIAMAIIDQPVTNLLKECCEMGRVVLAEAHRGHMATLAECASLAARHLSEHTPIRHAYLMARSPLARLYRRLGFSVLRERAYEHTDFILSLLHGNVADVLRHNTRSYNEG